MRRNQNQNPLLWLLPVPMLLWLAALLATEYKAGMTVFTLMGRLSWLMEHPFSVRWTPHTPKFMLWALATYGFAVALYSPVGSIVRPAELHSPSAEENCMTENVASLRSVKVATPSCAAKTATPCGLAVRKRF